MFKFQLHFAANFQMHSSTKCVKFRCIAYRMRYDDRFLLIYFKCFLVPLILCTHIHSHAHLSSSFVVENYTAVVFTSPKLFLLSNTCEAKTGNVLWNACKHYAIKNYEWLGGKILINIEMKGKINCLCILLLLPLMPYRRKNSVL